MNPWQKGITFISATVCIVALVALCFLASRTTAVDPKASQAIGAWPALPKRFASAEEDNALRMLINLLPLLKDQIGKIADTLDDINKSPSVVPKELVLSFKTPAALEAFIKRAAGEGITVLNSEPRLLAARVRYDSPQVMAMELSGNAGDYENASPNYLVWIPGLPSDAVTDASNAGGREPFGNSGMVAIGAEGDRSEWGKGVLMAIVDTGVTDHPSLSQTEVTHYDLVNDGLEPNGHGTAMASLAVGNGEGGGGAAQGTDILDIRVADVYGESNTALVAEAVMKAVDAGAAVINISLGTNGDAVLLRRAIDYALSQGVVVVAAAGNEQQTTLAYPAGYPGVISVGAVDANGTQAYFSNSGDTLTAVAPGVGIVSAYSDGRTVMGSGTSQAAAITSGVVATLLGRGTSPQGVAQALISSALQTGAPRQQVGAGVIHLP